MNFLAHLWLAERAQVPLAGAILGDVLRGALPAELPADLALSVRLHRRIDVETDRHPSVVAARARFPPGPRRYAGILLDLIYDHALALDWPRYSAEPLERFAAAAARDVAAQAHWFEHAGNPAPRAESFGALLQSYRSPASMEQVMRRTARRLRRPQGFIDAMQGWGTHLAASRAELPVLLEDLRQTAVRFAGAGAADSGASAGFHH